MLRTRRTILFFPQRGRMSAQLTGEGDRRQFPLFPLLVVIRHSPSSPASRELPPLGEAQQLTGVAPLSAVGTSIARPPVFEKRGAEGGGRRPPQAVDKPMRPSLDTHGGIVKGGGRRDAPLHVQFLPKWELFRKFPFWRFKLSTLCRQLDCSVPSQGD